MKINPILNINSPKIAFQRKKGAIFSYTNNPYEANKIFDELDTFVKGRKIAPQKEEIVPLKNVFKDFSKYIKKEPEAVVYSNTKILEFYPDGSSKITDGCVRKTPFENDFNNAKRVKWLDSLSNQQKRIEFNDGTLEYFEYIKNFGKVRYLVTASPEGDKSKLDLAYIKKCQIGTTELSIHFEDFGKSASGVAFETFWDEKERCTRTVERILSDEEIVAAAKGFKNMMKEVKREKVGQKPLEGYVLIGKTLNNAIKH